MSVVYDTFCNVALQPPSKAVSSAMTHNDEIRTHVFCINCYCFNDGKAIKQHLHIVNDFVLGAYFCHLREPFVCSLFYFLFNLSVSCLPIVERINVGIRLYYIWIKVMLAPNGFASSIAWFEASREYSDMSNGTKIFLITIMAQQPRSWVKL